MNTRKDVYIYGSRLLVEVGVGVTKYTIYGLLPIFYLSWKLPLFLKDNFLVFLPQLLMAMLNTEVSSFIILYYTYFSHKLYHCHISIQTHTLLLSLIPLSYIVALSSRLVNTLFSLNLNIIITPNIHNKDNMDMKIDTLRSRSDTDLPNTNSSKEVLVLSNTFSTPYVKRIKA